MSPTVLRKDGFRLFFFSREEPGMHVHVDGAEGEAKFWLEPGIGLAYNHGLKPRQLAMAEAIVRQHEQEVRNAWRRHFGP